MRRPTPAVGSVLGILAAVVGTAGLFLAVASRVAPGAARLVRSWQARVAVEGMSMAPSLLPGDWLLVDPVVDRGRSPSAGELVVVPDPREPARALVKRVASVLPDGSLAVAGDHAAHSTDSRAFGPIAAGSIVGRPWFRYWPLRRIGRLRSGAPPV